MRLVVNRVLSSLQASMEGLIISSPGHEESITRVSNTPCFCSWTVLVGAAAETVAPAAVVRFIQTPPRVSSPGNIPPPLSWNFLGPMLLGTVPVLGKENTRSSPGASRISAGM
jgi:hypothetical protein